MSDYVPLRPTINRSNYKEFRKMSEYKDHKTGVRKYNMYSVNGITRWTSTDADDYDRIAAGRVPKFLQVRPIRPRGPQGNELDLQRMDNEHAGLDKHKTYIKVWIKYKLSNWEHVLDEDNIKFLIGGERVHTKDDFAVILSNGPLSEEKLAEGVRDAQNALASKLEMMAGDYYDANVLERKYNITTLEEINKNTKDPMFIKMQKKGAIQYRVLDGVLANTPNTPGYCVLEYIMKKYGKTPGRKEAEKGRIAELTIPFLKDLLNWQEDDKGVCSWDLQLFCDKYKISHYALDITKRVYHKQLYKGRNRPALIYYMADGHIHPIGDKATRDRIIKCNADRLTESGFKNSSLLSSQTLDETDNKTQERIDRFKKKYYVDIPVTELKTYANCNIFYHTLNLFDLVEDIFFQDGVCPKIFFQGAQVAEIHYDNNVRLYRNCNHKVIRKNGDGLDWEDSMRMCKRFDVPFKNQSLTSLACEVYKKGFNNYGSARLARKRLDKMMKKSICEQQNNKCNYCKKAPIEEMDHIVPVSAGGSSDDYDNWQGLCRVCHSSKSAKENAERVFHIDNSISSYNATTKPVYLIPKSAIVHHFQDKDTVRRNKCVKTFGLDMNKCRKNIVLNNEFDYPVFSALDDIKVFNAEVHGEIPIGNYFVKNENLIPFKGNGWYSYVLVRYALEQKLITLDNITHVHLPSMHVRADSFNKFIVHIYKTAEDAEIAKFMVNSWIGTLGTKCMEKRAVHFTREPAEAAYLWSKNPETTRVDQKVYMAGEGVIGLIPEPFIEVWTINKTMQNDSYAPVYNQILDMEAIELHKICEILKSHGGELVYVNTDNAVAQFAVDKYPEKALVDIANTTFWDKDKLVPKYKVESELKSRSRNMQTISTEEFVLKKAEWNDMPDPGHNNFGEIAKMLVDLNQGVELGGSPGVGKTTLARAMIDEMYTQDKKVLLLAPTNKAARVLHPNAVTIHSIFNSKGNKCSLHKQMNKYDYIVVDEKSMIHEIFWRLFLDIKLNTNCLFVIIGDWTQLPPVNDRANFDYRNSSVINVLCDNNRMNLTVCRRSDPTLFNLYMQDDLKANVDIKKYGKELCERSLTYRNTRRKEINLYWMETKIMELEEDEYFLVEKNEQLYQSQYMYVYVGLPVMSILTNKTLEIANGETFEVKEITDTHVLINTWVVVDGEWEEIVKTVPRDEVNQYLVPAYCLTVHKSQGETFDFPYTIVDWHEMDQTLRYVALEASSW
jgi:hypothetical protein